MSETVSLNPHPLPYLTADLPGVGGCIKQTPEDFAVDEIPAYEPSGEGTHVYFRVVKRGVPTHAAVDRIARQMGVRSSDIGFAGLKDAQAVTRQWMSLEHADEQQLASYRDAQVHVEATSRHTNKLRTGHLRGNRFDVRIRGVEGGCQPAARAILDVLAARGVPNFFGQQRFGLRNDTAELGAALLTGDRERFVALLLGGPQADDPPDCRAAREAFDLGHYDRAMKRWPRHYANERKALAAFKRSKKAGPAIAAVDKRMRRLYVSACQSALFNRVLARRIGEIDRVRLGDLARKTDTGGVFPVEDLATGQPRAQRQEISPTGPLYGSRANLATGEPGRIEQAVPAEVNLPLDRFDRVGSLKVKGGRRALRFLLGRPDLQTGTDDQGPYLRLTFTAPPGSYATIALGELIKPADDRAAGL